MKALSSISIQNDFANTDIIESSAVICYDVPPFIKTYIHRVGRTARAGKGGICITFYTPKDDLFVFLIKINYILK